jgi:exonuclease SbcD
MRFAHVADLHIGKKLHELSLLGDQEEALSDLAETVRRARPDCVLIAGDVYDHPVPGADAVALFDRFLTELTDAGARVCLIGGNHDSQERLSFAGRILARQGVHIAGPYAGTLEWVEIADARVYLLPYVRPKEVERYFGKKFDSMQDAVAAILARAEIDSGRVNVLATHLFCAARGVESERSDSEIDPVGGLAEVDAALFDPFSYVALGHLHAPQRVGRDAVRYAGSLLKYSFSEARHRKSFVMGEVTANGVSFELVPVLERHGMREIRGRLRDLLSPDVVAAGNPEDYIRATLTDEVPPVSPMEQLSAAYKNVLRLELACGAAPVEEAVTVAERAPMALFSEFFVHITRGEMTENMSIMAAEAFDAAREGMDA